MTKGSDNAFPSILITEGTEPSAPAAGKQRMYIDSTSHVLMLTNSSGTESVVGASTTMATDALWDAAGDLAQGTGANTGAKLGAGTAGYFLKAGGAATAVAWAARELDYVQVTTGTTNITATSEATADTLITGSAVAYDGSTIVMVDAYIPSWDLAPDASTNGIVLCLYDGAAGIGNLCVLRGDASHYLRTGVFVSRRLTPSNATHTYSIRAYTIAAGTAHAYAGAAGTDVTVPMYIRITRAI